MDEKAQTSFFYPFVAILGAPILGMTGLIVLTAITAAKITICLRGLVKAQDQETFLAAAEWGGIREFFYTCFVLVFLPVILFFGLGYHCLREWLVKSIKGKPST